MSLPYVVRCSDLLVAVCSDLVEAVAVLLAECAADPDVSTMPYIMRADRPLTDEENDQVDALMSDAPPTITPEAMRAARTLTSGYCPCACRDCSDVAITDDARLPALCLDCRDAGCEIHDPETRGVECRRDDAYGCDDEAPDAL